MPEIEARLAALEAKIDEVAKITRKLYKIFLWTGIVTVAAIVLPLVLMAFAIPSMLSSYSAVLGI
jgi:uncharacterized membrane protein YukC